MYNSLIKNPNPDLTSLLNAQSDTLFSRLNCMKIAEVVSFNGQNRTCICNILQKKVTGINRQTGAQILQNYPEIFAVVHYPAWSSGEITFPLAAGDTGMLLFCDFELESWFIAAEAGQVKYSRKHSLSDAVFIPGVKSQINAGPVTAGVTIKDGPASLNLNKGVINIVGDGDFNITTTGVVNIKAAQTKLGDGGAAVARQGDSIEVTITAGSSAGTYTGIITGGGINTSI